MADMYLGNESGGFDLVGTTNIKNIDFEEVKISKEDYENLSEEERKTGIHLVTGLDDTENGGGSADLISYDNTNSGLGSTNVQGAIDELNSNLDDQNKNMGGLTFAQDAEGNWGYIPTGADSVIPFKKGTISFSKVHQFTGNNVTNYACEEDCYYLCVACGYYNSTSLSTGTITTSCSVTQVSSDKSYVSIWLVNGVKGQNIKLHVTGGGVGYYKFIIFKVTFG